MTVRVANRTVSSCWANICRACGVSLVTAGTTVAISESAPAAMFCRSSVTVCTAAAGSAAFAVSTTTTSGPLAPAPKFSEIRS